MGPQQLKPPLLDLENRMERHLSSPATLPQPCAHQTKMQSLDFRAQRCLIHILSSLYFSDVKSFLSPSLQPRGSPCSPCWDFPGIRRNMICSSEGRGRGILALSVPCVEKFHINPISIDIQPLLPTSSVVLPQGGISASHCLDIPCSEILEFSHVPSGLGHIPQFYHFYEVIGIPVLNEKIIPAPGVRPSATAVEGE